MSRFIMMILLVAAAALALGCSGQKDAPEESIEWLFVQNAEHATLKDGLLTLEGISPTTLFFSDRPEKIAANGLTTEFLTYWDQGGGDDNFKKNPPNAALAVVTKNTEEDVVLTLTNPRLVDETLQYDVTIIEGNPELAGGPVSLFIDVVGRPLTPVSVAGVARRTSRRTVRRMDARR